MKDNILEQVDFEYNGYIKQYTMEIKTKHMNYLMIMLQ